MDTVLLIDAHNAMWRASISFAPRKVEHIPAPPEDDWKMYGDGPPAPPAKEPNEKFVLIYNFFRNLRPIIEQVAPDKCFFVLEGHPKFRYDLFSDYKANRLIKQASRQEQQDKFVAASGEIIRLMQYLPITLARAANYEADDLIGTLCENMKDESLIVLSNDSDYIQLLQHGYRDITVYNPIKKVCMEAPDYPYVAWKSLAGDKSDNIPALLKPKTRAPQLASDMLKNPESFRKFMDVEEQRANFNVNRRLIEFRAVPEDEIALQDGNRNFAVLKEEFDRMEFQSITNDKSWAKYTKTFDCLKY